MDCSRVIGIYGVSGSGKSRALSVLASTHQEWRCLEGSQVLQGILSEQGESLEDFHRKPESDKATLRNRAVEQIQGHDGLTVVAGHCSFPRELTGHDTNSTNVFFDNAFTKGDAETYSAILYLDKDADVIARRRKEDNNSCKRWRPQLSENEIDQWIQYEKSFLQDVCETHGILFALIADDDLLEEYIVRQVLRPLEVSVKEKSEASLAKAAQAIPAADVFLLIDGDRTMCPMDTGAMFFDHFLEDPLKKIFKRYHDYCFEAFFEVAMLYEKSVMNAEYIDRSVQIGKDLQLYDEWIDFISRVPSNVVPIVLTSGNRDIWKAALASTFSENHKVGLIAGNHIGLHEYIVDSNAKATVVRVLRELHAGCQVLSFGDSAIDIPMISASDRAYIVLDDRRNRSMRDFIRESVDSKNAHSLYQILFAQCATSNSSFLHQGIAVASLDSLLDELSAKGIHKVMEYAKSHTSAAILATQTRRADLSGPALQATHAAMGRFLAERLLDENHFHLVRDQTFSHVQGTAFSGVATVDNVLILPLMRGGEPMSRGVFEMFPAAQLIHYDDGDDKSTQCLKKAIESKKVTDVIIVDSVINRGNSVRRVLDHIQSLLDPQRPEKVRLYVLAGHAAASFSQAPSRVSSN